VLANRYGDSRDKASLLLALAAAQGISGNVVLTRTGHVPVLSGVPTVAQFDHLLVALDLDGHEVWLDPSDENGQFGLAYAGQESLSLKLAPAVSEPFVRPAHAPAESVARVNVRLALGQNGDLDADYRYELSGYYATRASDTLRPLEGEPLARFFQSAAIGVAATALDRSHRVGDTRTVLGAISVSQRVLAPGYAPAQAQFRVVELPSIPLSLADDVPSPSLSTRNDPLYVGVPRSSDVELTLQVPPGWRVAYAPPKLDGTALGIAYTSECRAAAQSVTCHNHVALDQIVVPSESYPGFREALSRLNGYDRRVVLLTRN